MVISYGIEEWKKVKVDGAFTTSVGHFFKLKIRHYLVGVLVDGISQSGATSLSSKTVGAHNGSFPGVHAA